MKNQRALLRPDRLRNVERPFGWVPCCMLTQGILTSMSPLERQLYLMLVLAADRHGISFYGDKSIRQILGYSQAELLEARSGLVARDLLAYDGATYQLLSLPAKTSKTTNPTSVRLTSLSSTPSSRVQTQQNSRQGVPESAREILRRLFDPA